MRSKFLLPFHLAALASGAKSFRDNPLIGSERLNAWGLHTARLKLAERMARAKRRRLAHLLEPEHLRSFERDGFVAVPGLLPDPDFKALLAEVEQTEFEAREMKQGRTVTRFITLSPGTLHSLPYLRSLVRHPLFQGLLRYGACWNGDPLVTLHTVLPPGPDADDPQSVLHTDTFHACAKGWFFLRDVEMEDGPFSYVPGSHYASPQRLAWERRQSLAAARSDNPYHARGSFRVSVEEVRDMGYADPLPLTVPANTLVVADTHGFHARVPSQRPAVRLAVYGSLRRNPFIPWSGGDLLDLPGLRGRRAQLLDLRRDLVSRLGGRPDGQPVVGYLHPTDPPRR